MSLEDSINILHNYILFITDCHGNSVFSPIPVFVCVPQSHFPPINQAPSLSKTPLPYKEGLSDSNTNLSCSHVVHWKDYSFYTCSE